MSPQSLLRRILRPFRGERRRQWLAAVSTCLIVLILATVGVLLRDQDDPAADRGDTDIAVDLDGDGNLDATVTGLDENGEKVEVPLAEITHDRDLITTLIGPQPFGEGEDLDPQDPLYPNTTDTILTPAGDDWWGAATSQAPELRLWEADTPEGANWYAATRSPASTSAAPARNTYSALHIGFGDHDALSTYLTYLGTEPTLAQYIVAADRGSVLTLTPTWVDPWTQPLPVLKGDHAKALGSIRPRAAAWTINYAARVKQTALNAASPKYKRAYEDMMAALGYTDQTRWSGVATDPDGPWTGQVEGFDDSAIDSNAAAVAIAKTRELQCDEDGMSCLEVSTGLLDLTFAMAYVTPDGNGIGVSNTRYLPQEAPEKALLRFGFNDAMIAGVLNGTHENAAPPMGLISGWITPEHTQVLYLRPVGA